MYVHSHPKPYFNGLSLSLTLLVVITLGTVAYVNYVVFPKYEMFFQMDTANMQGQYYQQSSLDK